MKIIFGVVEKDGIKTREHIILENRKCEQCGIEFEPQTQRGKYCSRECSKCAEKEQNKGNYQKRAREYYDENTEKCKQRHREYYWKNAESLRLKAKEYREKNYDEVRARDLKYKDRIRHGGKRDELVQQNGLKCSNCGYEGTSFEITAHHATFDSMEHDSQELLCRRCHQRIHRMKLILEEDIIDAIKKTKTIAMAAKILGISRGTLLMKRKKYNLI